MIRILLDCRMATWTGVGRYTTGLVRALARRDDLELVLLSATGDAPVVEGDNVATVFSAKHPFTPRGMMAFGNVAASVRPDLTHCLHFPTPPLPFRKPLVVTLHDLTPLLVRGVMPSAGKRRIYQRLNERAVRLADAIIAVSANTAADVEREFPQAVGKTRVVLESADDFSAGDIGPLPEHLEHLADKPYVMSMGSTRSHKDLPALISAFALIAQRNPDLRLVFVGAEVPGYIEAELAGRPLIADRVEWTGRVTDAELRALYADATVFAFPSLYEGFGLPPLEAMAMGTPVVASNSSSLPQVIDDAGILVPPADPRALAKAIERVLRDSGLREQLVEAGTRRASQLTWAAAAEGTVAVYREVLGR